MAQINSVARGGSGVGQERFRAMVNADIGTLNRILSDNLSYTHASSTIGAKESFTAAFAAGTLNYESIPSKLWSRILYGTGSS